MLTSRPNNEGVSARDADPLFQTTQHHDFDAEHGAVKRQATAAAKLALAGFCLLSALLRATLSVGEHVGMSPHVLLAELRHERP